MTAAPRPLTPEEIDRLLPPLSEAQQRYNREILEDCYRSQRESKAWWRRNRGRKRKLKLRVINGPASDEAANDDRPRITGGVPVDDDRNPAERAGITLQLENLPAALTAQPNWILWRWERVKGNWTKPPYQPSGAHASSNKAATWTTHERACAALPRYSGLGFCLQGTDFVAFDIDNCRDAQTGAIHPWALELVAKAQTYTEVTVSGTGLRIIGTGTGPKNAAEKLAVTAGVSCEIYRKSIRYITMSGNRLPDTPAELADLDPLIDATLAELLALKATRPASRGNGASAPRPIGEDEGSDAEPGDADDEIERLITEGLPSEHSDDADRSALLYKVLMHKFRAGVKGQALVALLMDDENGIHRYIVEKGGSNPDLYARRQVEQTFQDFRAEAAAAKAEAADAVAELNKRYAVISTGSQTVVMRIKRNHDVEFMSAAAFKLLFANRRVKVKGKARSLADYWLTNTARRQYLEGIVFQPEGAVPDDTYNLWLGFGVEPRAGDCSKFLAYVRDVVCGGNDDHTLWVLGWFAQIFQQPGHKIGTSLVLRGPMGAGKTTLGLIVGSLLGPKEVGQYVRVADTKYVTGNFNFHLKRCLLLHAEEAFWAGDKRAESVLKDMVTSDTLALEGKNKDLIFVENFVRLLVTGNPDWQVPAGFDERRFTVLDVSREHLGDEGYFKAIYDEMENGGRAALLHYLLHFDLSQVNLRLILKTQALLDQKLATMGDIEKWWYQTLMGGLLPWGAEETNSSPSDALFSRYIQSSKEGGYSRRAIETRVAAVLEKLVGDGFSRRRQTYKALDRHGTPFAKWGTVYRFPPLAVCREAFAQKVGQALIWPEDAGEWQRDVPRIEPDAKVAAPDARTALDNAPM